MINRIVHFALHQRVLVLVAAVILLIWGVASFFQLPIEAYPDVMNTQVQIITQWPGHAAEEVEKLISVPLETSLNGVPTPAPACAAGRYSVCRRSTWTSKTAWTTTSPGSRQWR